MVIRSLESLDALHRELGLAMQMRGLTRFYAAFAHDLDVAQWRDPEGG